MNKRSVFKRIVSAVLSLSMVLSYIDAGPLQKLTSLVMDAVADTSVDPKTAEPGETDRALLKEDSRRVYLYWNNSGDIGGLEKKNYIHVYAKAGETITFGSNVYDSQFSEDGKKVLLDPSGYDIVMIDVNNRRVSFDVDNATGKGYIGSYKTELAAKLADKLESDKDGYKLTYESITFKPLTYSVHEEGVYTFEFRSRDGGGHGSRAYPKNSTDAKAFDPVVSGSTKCDLVSAWDVSVFNESGDREVGRTYADYLSVETDGNVVENYWIVTTDSYIYRMDFNGCSPYTYSFFANNRGIFNNANGNTVYKSAKNVANYLDGDHFEQDMGVIYKYPGTSPDALDRSFYIFFDMPDVEDLTGNLFDKPVLPDPIEDLKFEGMVKDPVTGEVVPGTYVGMGGDFSFFVKQATTVSLKLTFDGDYEPVEISGPVKPFSRNTLHWDGRDGNGVILPAKMYNAENLTFEVTTKSGEIHFPITDMECASGGLTFTRVSDLYDSSGRVIKDNIYEKTKSVIYYDDTAIYYGEKVTPQGKYESEADAFAPASGTANRGTDHNGNTYSLHANMRNDADHLGGEYEVYFSDPETSQYAKDNKLRVGDHSHTSNRIDYTMSYESQAAMIEYLDSAEHPVGKTNKSAESKGNESVTDHAIANFYTFIPNVNKFEAGAVDLTIDIVDPEEAGVSLFNYTGRVFYDSAYQTGGKGTQGIYDTMYDKLLDGITVELYKKSEDNEPQEGIKYFKYDETKEEFTQVTSLVSNPVDQGLYELVESAETDINGQYTFSNVPYNKTKGSEFIYKVKRPNTNYQLKTAEKSPKDYINKKLTPSGVMVGFFATHYYIGYKEGSEVNKGKEVQKFTVGGASGVDVDEEINTNADLVYGTIAAADVGYYYDLMDYTIQLKKDWKTKSTDGADPNTVYYELSYATSSRYDFHYANYSVSAAYGWLNNQDVNYPPKTINGIPVTDYYISAEYYFKDGILFKHEFDYNGSAYTQLTGKTYYYAPSANSPLAKDILSLTDMNRDGVVDIEDLSSIPSAEWTEYDNVRTDLKGISGDKVVPYHAVVDKNVVEGKTDTTISVTNSSESLPGVIEIYKHDDGGAPLRGATFRLYKGDLTSVKNALENSDPSNDPDIIQTSTTRVNGRFAFTGLDTAETYTVRELYPPTGYRLAEEYYEVKPVNTIIEDGEHVFDSDGHCTIDMVNLTIQEGFTIRKKLEGRAWIKDGGIKDTFTFDMQMTGYVADSNEGNVIDPAAPDTVAENFKNAFNVSSDSKIIIDADSDYYSYEDETGLHGSADTKVSKQLLTNSGNKAVLCDNHEFPAAGEYTFTITEQAGTEGVDSKLTYSTEEYEVTVSVVRKFNKGVEDPSTGALPDEYTTENSHLEANVTKVALVGGGLYTTPLFTNVYSASVEDKTQYEITKTFTGRTDDEWLKDDKFTFVISGKDTATQEALQKGNLFVESKYGGSDPKVVLGKKSPSASDDGITSWTAVIDDKDDIITIDEIDFEDIIFPVQYVYTEDGETKVLPNDPTEEDYNAHKDIHPVTLPVTYVLSIKEQVPADAEENVSKGIKYSDISYELEMILENEYEDITTGTDGVIDKVTLDVYTIDAAGNRSGIKLHCVIDNKEPAKSTHEKDHSIPFSNKYSTKVEWYPAIDKELIGREWDDNDRFQFELTCEGAPDGVNKNGFTRYLTIRKENAGDVVPFVSPVTIEKPGKYTFKVSETSNGGGFTVEQPDRYFYIEAVDNNDGTMTLYQYPDDSFTEAKVEVKKETVDGVSRYQTSFEFTNNYEDEPKEIPLNITKKLEGRSWASGEKFTFLFEPDIDTEPAIGEFVKMGTGFGADYSIEVPEIGTDTNITINKCKSNNDEDTYEFKLSEQKPADAGNIEYSKEIHTLIIKVKRARDSHPDNAHLTGELDVRVYLDKKLVYGKEEDTEEIIDPVEISFTNAAYTESELTVNKVIVGEKRTWGADEKFTAKIELESDSKDNVKVYKDDTEFDIGTNSLEFTAGKQSENLKFKFYEAGTYTFTITEDNGSIDDLAYDPTAHKVVFKVAPDLTDVSVTVDGKDSEALDIVNVAVGKIIVSKEVIDESESTDEGSTDEPKPSFDFTITIKDGTPGDSRDDYLFDKFTSEMMTFQLKDGDSKTFEGIPYGANYTITETTVPGYTTSVKVNGGASVDSRECTETINAVENTVEYVNTKLKEADLKISKVVDSVIEADHRNENENAFKFTVDLTAPTGTIFAENEHYSVTGAKENNITRKDDKHITVTLTIIGENSAVIKGFPVGTAYDVSEDVPKDSLLVPDKENYTGYIEADDTTVTCTNTRKTGQLTISKTVTKADGVTVPVPKKEFEFTVTITGMSGGEHIFDCEYISGKSNKVTFNGDTATIKLTDGDAVTITGLPLDAEYSVAETEDKNYYTLVSDGAELEYSSLSSGNIGAASSAAFTNIYIAQPEKTLSPVPAGNIKVGDELTYNITWHNNSEHAGKVVITDNLPDGLTYVSSVPAVSSQAGQKLTWELDNKDGYSSGKVSVTVKVNEQAVGKTFFNSASVEIEDIDTIGYYKQEYAARSDTISVGMGSVQIFKNISGSAAQKDADAGKSFEFTLTADGLNGYKLNGSYDYVISPAGSTGSIKFTNGVSEITLEAGQNITINGLPEGAEITVTEGECEGYTTTVSDGKGDTFTGLSYKKIIENGETAEFHFTNSKNGDNTKKIKDGVYGGAVSVGDEFTYEITWNNNNDDSADITISDELDRGLEFVSAEPKETRITGNKVIWELGSKPANSSGTVTLTVRAKEAAVKWNGINTAVIQVDDETPEDVPTGEGDTVTVNTGSISIEKTVTNTVSSEYFTFTIDASVGSDKLNERYSFEGTIGLKGSDGNINEITDGAIQFDKGIATVMLKHGQRVQINGLPSGTVYTIEEAAVPGYMTTIGTDDTPQRIVSGEVPLRNNAEIKYTNNKLDEHDLTIEKIVTGSDSDPSLPWEFEVEFTAPQNEKGAVMAILADKYGYESVGGVTVDWTPDDKGDKLIGKFTIRSGQNVTIKGLPDGTTYSIKEKDVPENYEVRATTNKTNEQFLLDNELGSGLRMSAALSGSVQSGNKHVIFTNESPIPSSAEGRYGLTKIVKGVEYGADKSKVWDFRLKFKRGLTGLTGEYSYYKTGGDAAEDGIITVTKGKITKISIADPDKTSYHDKDDTLINLRDGELITIYRLPAGVTVTATEENVPDGYVTTFSTSMASFASISETGSTDGEAAVPGGSGVTMICTNTLQPGTLKISKEIYNKGGDLVSGDNTEFDFDIVLKNKDDTPFTNDFYAAHSYEGRITWAKDSNELCTGAGTLTIKGGDSFSIGNLPDGTKYTVTEQPSEGYVLKEYVDCSGSITANNTSEAVIKNTRLDRAGITVTKRVESDIDSDRDIPFGISLTFTPPEGTILNNEYHYSFSTDTDSNDHVLTLRRTEDGKWQGLIDLKDGVSATIKALPEGMTVYADEPGLDTDLFDMSFDPIRSIEVDSDTENKIEVINTRKTASLTISKEIFCDAGLSDEDGNIPFEFSVELSQPDGTELSGPYAYTIYNDEGPVSGEETIQSGGSLKLLNKQSAVIEGLPLGAHYVVNEISGYDGYKPRVSSFDGDISAVSADNTAAFVNDKLTGTLKISKNVVHSDGSELCGSSTEERFTFTVELYILSGTEKIPVSGKIGDDKFSGGEIYITNGNSVQIEGLPAGTVYSVTETEKTGYISEVTKGASSATIGSGTVSEIEFTNTKSVGSLTVSKTVENKDTKITSVDTESKFDFDLTLENSRGMIVDGTYDTSAGGTINVSEGKAHFSLGHNESLTIYGIPEGTSCLIEEADNSVYDVLIKVDDADSETAMADIKKDSVSKIEFINVKKAADLTVIKEIVPSNAIVGVTEDDSKIPFEFNIELEGISGEVRCEIVRKSDESKENETLYYTDGKSSNVILHHGDSITLKDVPIGTNYTISEITNDSGYVAEETGGKISGGPLPEGGESKIFRNDKVSNSLTISKKVKNSDDSPLSSNTSEEKFDFSVEIKDDGITFGEAEVIESGGTEHMIYANADDEKFHIQLGNDEYVTFIDLPVGAVYSVTETEKAGYTSEVTKGASSSTITAETASEVEFTNTKSVGSLTITNVVEVVGGQQLSESDTAYPFSFDIRLSSMARAANGLECEYPAYIGPKDSSAGALPNAKVSFNADGDLIKIDQDGNTSSELILVHGTEIIIYGISSDLGYEVTETKYDGYSVSVNNSAENSYSGQILSVPIVNFKNTRYVGNLEVSKSVTVNGVAVDVSNADDPDNNVPFSFTLSLCKSAEDITALEGSYKITYTYSDGSGSEDSISSGGTITLKNGDKATISGLPEGTYYTLTEEANSVYTPDESTISGDIKAGATAQAAFVNNRKIGTLEVSKSVTVNGVPVNVSNANDPDNNVPFSFTLSLYKSAADPTELEGSYSITYAYSNGTASESIISSGGTITLKNGDKATISGLPEGTYYTLTEEANSVYTPDESTISGNISAEATAQAAFVNNRKIGTLEVSKSVTVNGVPVDVSNADDPDNNVPFNFTLSLYKSAADPTELEGSYSITYAYSDGTGSESIISSGGTITLKNGDKATISGLPEGTQYTLTEEVNSEYTPETDTISGGIIEGAATQAAFVNNREIVPPQPEYGSLTLTKSVNVISGTPNDDDEFTFSIMLEYPDGTSETQTVTLKNGESYSINDLPEGTKYTITETIMPTGYTPAQPSINGTIGTGSNSEVFVNNFGGGTVIPDPPHPETYGDVDISKKVVDVNGNDISGEITDSFEFIIEISRDGGDKEFGSFEYQGSAGSSGEVESGGTIKIKAGETVTLKDIPSGDTIKVKEVVPENYSVNGTAVMSRSVLNGQENKIEYVNIYHPAPDDPKVPVEPDDPEIPEDPDDAVDDTDEPEEPDVPDITEGEPIDSDASSSSEEDELPDSEHKDTAEYPNDAEEAKEPEELEVPDDMKRDGEKDIPYEPVAQDNPKTGNIPFGTMISAFAAAAAAMLFSKKKK